MKKIIDIIKLRINGYLVIDDFFPAEICDHLRNLTLTYQGGSSSIKNWSNYQAINFDLDKTDISLRAVSNQFVLPKVSFLKNKNYSRAWSLRFNTIGTGVGPHTDPSRITVNVWVTPNECTDHEKKNGLIIYKKKRPKGPWEQYSSDETGWSIEQIRKYLKKTKYDIIPYKFNRAIVFMGDTFHETCDVRMKPGIENTRVSYTFLYD
jgi:hypothetical protein